MGLFRTIAKVSLAKRAFRFLKGEYDKRQGRSSGSRRRRR